MTTVQDDIRGHDYAEGFAAPLKGQKQGHLPLTESGLQQSSPATPNAKPPMHSIRGRVMSNGGGSSHDLHSRALMHSMNAPGVQTFNQKYIPFAAGFAHTPEEAAVYRSSRLHTINPTAAATEDVSYYWTLDSGKTSPAAMAANPDTEDEFVRNTRTAARGGFVGSLMKATNQLKPTTEDA